jgi:hypothetical protein
LAVVRSICQLEPGILENVQEKVRLRLKDTDIYVVAAALRLLGDLSQVRMPFSREVCVQC